MMAGTHGEYLTDLAIEEYREYLAVADADDIDNAEAVAAATVINTLIQLVEENDGINIPAEAIGA